MTLDPEDLNVEDEESYKRFCAAAERHNAELNKDKCLLLQVLQVEEGLTQWEIEFAEATYSKVMTDGIRLTEAQAKRLNKTLERLGK